jgi:hypothetical protein
MIHFCFAPDEQYLRFLKNHYSGVDLQLITNPAQFFLTHKKYRGVVLLASPFHASGQLLALERAWRYYLLKDHPYCKLVTCGFTETSHHNHIDLLNLPLNLEEFLEKAKTSGIKWDIVRSSGLDIAETLRYFFDGHGKESIAEKAYEMLGALQMLHGEIVKNESPFDEQYPIYITKTFAENWKLLNDRWEKHFFLWKYLPFFDIFEEMFTFIETISSLMPEHVIRDKHWLEQMLIATTELRNCLLKAKRYVPEKT